MPVNNRNIKFADKLSVWTYDKNDIIRSRKNIHSENIRYNKKTTKTTKTINLYSNKKIWLIFILICLIMIIHRYQSWN
jgi:hypothetical protein